MKAYITPDNASNLARQIRFTGYSPAEPLFDKPIPFFSIWERQVLMAHRELMRNPRQFFANLYFPVQRADTQKFIHEPGRPEYHKEHGCPEFEINFRKYLIPATIRDKGNSAVRTYRRWFKAIKHYLEQGKPEIFLAHLKAKWDISVHLEEVVQIITPNLETRNDDLKSIENRIIRLLEKADWYLGQSEAHKIILEKYHKSTFLAHTEEPLRDNNTGFDDATVKEILNAFDTTFKRPLKHLLGELYRLQFNAELTFDKALLNKAGMDKCKTCHHPEYRNPVSRRSEDSIYFEDMLHLRSLNWKWEDVSGLN